MRDRLCDMQTISEEQEESDSDQDLYDPECDVDKGDLTQEAVVFMGPSLMDAILAEAHSIRKEISILHLDVEQLAKHNERIGTTMRRLTVIKQDSNSIAKGIQQHGEALYARLQALGEQSRDLEEKHGPNAAVARIARTQHAALTRSFHDAMFDYNEAEEAQRCACRTRLQRQASIMGKEVTGEQLDSLVEKGGEGWGELSLTLQTDGRSSRWALCEIKGRHKELVELEARLKQLQELFVQMAMVVEEQGCMVNSIESNVFNTKEYIYKVNEEIKMALHYKRKNPCQQCCSCLPWS